MMRGVLFYGAMILIAAFLLQFLTPFPILTWPQSPSSFCRQQN
jgi:hypothetical protein